MRTILLIIALVLGLASSADAQTPPTVMQNCGNASYPVLQGDQLVCSYSVQFDGTCNGADMWNQWTLTASPAPSPIYGPWAVTPWENHWVKIVGHKITDMTPGDGHPYWQIGSTYPSDIEGGIGTENNGTVMYPSGLVWMFPPVGYVSPNGRVLKDLHGSCPTIAPGTLAPPNHATVMVTFYYVDASALAPPPPPPPLCTTFDSLNPADKAAGITLSSGNLMATSDGANAHELVRAVTGIAPSTLRVHFEWSISGSANEISYIGLQDASTPTNASTGSGGTGFAVGYSNSAGFVHATNFTPAPGASSAMPNGTYALDYDSFSGVATVTGASGYSVTRTMTGTPAIVFPAVSMYGTPASTVTYNFGASPFMYPVPSGYQAGLCQ